MKRILSTLFLALTLLPIFAQNMSVENPVMLLNNLMSCYDEHSMARVCRAYQMEELPSEDGFWVFKNQDGSVVRFKYETNEKNQKTPVIEIQTTQNKKSIEKNLSSLGFRKSGEVFMKGSEHANSQIICNYTENLFGKNITIGCRKLIK